MHIRPEIRITWMIVCLLLVLCCQASAVGSSEPDQEDQTLYDLSLDELLLLRVSVATRSEVAVKDIPKTVVVVDRETILARQYRSLCDLLKDVVGVRVSQPGSAIEGELFTMRGLWGNSYAKILVNGLPISPSVVSGFPIAEQLSMQNVSAVEIVEGPVSALYGADSVAGVINILTLDPPPGSVRFGVMLGPDGYTSGNAHATAQLGSGPDGVRLTLLGSQTRRDDLDIFDNHLALYREREPGFRPQALKSRAESVGLQLQYRGIRLMLDRLSRADSSAIGQRADWYVYEPNAIWGETIDRLAVKHIHEARTWTLTNQLSFLRYRLDPQSSFHFTWGETVFKHARSNDLFLESIVNWRPAEELSIDAGISYTRSKGMPKSNDLTTPYNQGWHPQPDPVLGMFGFHLLRPHGAGAFVQGTWSTGKLGLMASLRYDDHSRYGASLTPQVAMRYNLAAESSLRLSYGEAYRSPNPYFAYNSVGFESPDNPGLIWYIAVPNPELEPEQLTSYELGLRHLLNRTVSLELITYLHQLDNLINEVILPVEEVVARFPNADPSYSGTPTAANSGSSRLVGVDLIVTAKELSRQLGLDGQLIVSYGDGVERLPDDAGTIDDFRTVPSWTVKLSLDAHPNEHLQLGLDATWVDSWYRRNIFSAAEYRAPGARNDGYATLDATVRWRLGSTATHLDLRADNLLDEAYGGIGAYSGVSSLRYNPQLGRSIYLGLSIEHSGSAQK